MPLLKGRTSSMTEVNAIAVEVACATPEQQKIVALNVPAGSSARLAVERSGIQQLFQDVDVASCALGIFGKAIQDDHVLAPGDRVEVYRPLLNEPRTARRQRAADGKTMGLANDIARD